MIGGAIPLILGGNMKTLRYGSSGEQVKILQGLLNITTDGNYGVITKAAVTLHQKQQGLSDDGVCGPATWGSFYYVPSKSSKLYVQKIPFHAISRTDVLLHDKDKTYSVSKFAHESGADIVINGAMFDMRTYQNVTDLVINGLLNNGGNYSDKGITFAEAIAYASTTSGARNKPVDFIGGAPILIQGGVKMLDMHGLGASYYGKLTKRIAVGCDPTNLYIITTGQANDSNLETVVNEGLYQGVRTLINLDGGGSTAMCIHSRTVFTTGRNIPSVIAVLLKKKAPKKRVVIDAGHGGADPGAVNEVAKEMDINLSVAHELYDLLGTKYDTYMPRASNVYMSLEDRAEYINTVAPDLTVSIHHNACGGFGFEIYHKVNSPDSVRFAALLQAQFEALGQKVHFVGSRTQKDGLDWYAAQRWVNTPHVIAEYAYMDTADFLKIDTLPEQKAEAAAIKRAIDLFFSK
jgi:N-acetylmuramoyl-L-alanine amidase